MRLTVALVAVIPLGLGCHGGGSRVARSTAHFNAGTGFIERQIEIEGQRRTLWLFLPKNYHPTKTYPAIVFLHGLFEAAPDGSTRALSAGLAPVIASSPDDWPFIVLFPQSSGTWRGEARERQVMQSLDWAQRRFAIDRSRVILAGLSYGGLGAWQIGARHPHRFAAIVPIAGKRDLECADGLVSVPVWAFHNRADPFVSADDARRMCERITELGGQARFTAFPRVGHDCCDMAIEQTDLIDWLLSRRAPAVALSATE